MAAVVFGEPEAEMFVSTMLANIGDLIVSAATLVETTIVLEARQGPAATQDLRELLEATEVAVVPLGEDHVSIAAAAWRRFGKGRHPAGLNLGDCYSYALSKATGFPLLFKGDDFAKTDIARAL